MTALHRLTIEAQTVEDVVFTCPEPGCGRRVVVNRAGEIAVIARGDFFAFHSGGTDGLDVGLGVH
jgi:hypothetical protein